MPGFPTRVLRRVFGPKHRDARPVENPETEIGAAVIEPLLWQVAGLNLGAPRASVVASWNGAAFVYTHRSESWNADERQAHPALARQSAGVYTLTFAATYPDEDDVNVPTVLGGARVACLKVQSAFADRVEARAWVDATDPLVVRVRLWNSSGTAVDEPFWLEVL